MTTKRIGVIAASAGLVGGLALGVTGLASAAGSTPTPGPQAKSDPAAPLQGHGHGRGLRHGARAGAAGLLTSVSASSLTVATPQGSKTFSLSSSTHYYVGQASAKQSALAVGEIVAVRPTDPRATALVAAVVRVLPAHLAGWVTKVDGSTVTLTDVSGFTRTLTTTGDTTYTKDGATATSSVLVTGAFVRAVGQVAQDGTTLTATHVGVGRPAGKGPGAGEGPAGSGAPGPMRGAMMDGAPDDLQG
jgi:hypothetical protein